MLFSSTIIISMFVALESKNSSLIVVLIGFIVLGQLCLITEDIWSSNSPLCELCEIEDCEPQSDIVSKHLTRKVVGSEPAQTVNNKKLLCFKNELVALHYPNISTPPPELV